MDENFEHLTDAQIEQYGNRISGSGPDENQELETHLTACAGCRTRVLASQRSHLAVLADPDVKAALHVKTAPHAGCPDEDALRYLAAGLCPPNQAAQLTQHAAQCDLCGPLLRAYTEDFSDELSPDDQSILANLQSTSPAWQRDLVQKMQAAAASDAQIAGQISAQPAESHQSTLSTASNQSTSSTWSAKSKPATDKSKPSTESPRRSGFPWFKWVLVPTAVAACAAVAFFVWYQQRETPEKVEKLLAQAYTEQRTMEMRMPGAQWGELKATRGSSDSEKPLSFLNARDILTAHENDLRWATDRAELAILSHHPRTAIEILEPSIGKELSATDAVMTLTIAYTMLGDDTGNHLYYERALELLNIFKSGSINYNAALFNRALVFERLKRTDEAVAAWNSLVDLEHDPQWSQEIRRRLAMLKAPNSK